MREIKDENHPEVQICFRRDLSLSSLDDGVPLHFGHSEFHSSESCITHSRYYCLLDNFVRDSEKSPLEAFKVTQAAPQSFELGELLSLNP